MGPLPSVGFPPKTLRTGSGHTPMARPRAGVYKSGRYGCHIGGRCIHPPIHPYIMPSVDSLKDLLIEELKDLYSAEKQLVRALPKMAKAADNAELKQGFLDHLEETRGHVQRLEQAFEALGSAAKAKTCEAMKGLIAEGEETMDLEGPAEVRDCALIGAAQRVEHYEIAAYGTVRAIAETIGEDDVATLLQATLDEEGATDKKLTEIAETVNEAAQSAADDASSDEE